MSLHQTQSNTLIKGWTFYDLVPTRGFEPLTYALLFGGNVVSLRERPGAASQCLKLFVPHHRCGMNTGQPAGQPVLRLVMVRMAPTKTLQG